MTEYTFDEVWPLLEAVLRPAHAVLAEGCENANRIREAHPEIVTDGILWSGNVRGYAARRLGAEIREDGYSLDVGFNLSTTLQGKGISVRVLKAADGKMPRADSPGRKKFFNQNVPLPFLESELEKITELPPKAPNFILKWSSDEYGQLAGLELGHPKPLPADAGPDYEHEWFWIENIYERTKPDARADSGQMDIEDIPGLERQDDQREDDARGTGTDDKE